MKCKRCHWTHGLRRSSYNNSLVNRVTQWFFVWVRCDLCGMVFRARGPVLGGRIPRDTSIEEQMLNRSLSTQNELSSMPIDTFEQTGNATDSKAEVHA